MGGQPVPTALLLASGNLTQAGIYNNIGNAFAASAPTAGSGQQADKWRTDTQSFALFTHNQLNITDALMLTVGLRFNHEEKELTGDLNAVQPACNTMRSASILPIANAVVAQQASALSLLTIACNPAVNSLQNGLYADKVTDNEWTGMASLSAKLTPDALVYASYSRGYKAGGFNLDRSSFSVLPTTTVQRPSDDLQFKPEFVDAYEIGLKTTLSPAITFNATAFYQEITDYQLNEFAGFNFQTRNIAESISKGIELETVMRPFTGLTLNGGAVYNEAYFNSPVVFPNETLPAGTEMRQAPKYSVTGSAAYEFPVAEALTGLLYLDARWNSEYRTQTIARNPLTDNDAYTLVNARVGLSHENGWGVEVFAQNLTDQHYYIGGFNPPEQPGSSGVYPGLPRTIGLTLKAQF